MQHDLLNQLLKITDEEELILQNRKEINKDIYTNQSNFIIESQKFLNQESMIMVRKHTRFVDFPKHKHNYIEINYVYNGELNQKVGNQKISLQQGELLFLNQHIEHEIQACAEEDIIINFIIQPKFFDFIFSFLTTENRISNFLINSLYNSTQNGQFLYFKVSEVESIQDLIKRIIIEIMSPAFMSESTIKLYMGLLMVELIKHADKAEHTEDYPVQHYLIVESLKYIDEHFQSASLYELASKLNQPDYALSKEIKKATNYTFKELIQEKRLIKAKELLESTDIPIASVIDQVGYDNVSYFYRIFKNKYNQTPKQFREHLAKK
ncbi:AraC family transcriptional regulator [Priestia megaterium]|uniref:AraC family transcriptional regulator n=2 Tax=Priestia megaterium TaxID=1404 RepID=UPI00177C6ED6|nr:AraC family transcriptional regulator [Priestia megaterium]MBD8847900.1 helix-turn-helix domain-containing protein [Priestia megaterium]MCF6799792.1 AraC family transcriptional regulator [Bacillus sp. ET1]MDN4866003.1 AraC family transcriptional regulator [Priestia megaterium]MED4184257.1 AraC family transcriptional regulator [Priestia megaterium]